MESDLATLPMYFADKNDYILAPNKPSESLLNLLIKLGKTTPNFIKKEKALSSKHFLQHPKKRIIPWGWSPAAHKLLAPLKLNCSEEFKKSPVFNWKNEYKNLYSKRFAMEILTELVENYSQEFFLSSNEIPRVCTTQNDFENLIQEWNKLMVKAPWSSSGRGLQPIRKTPVHPKVWEKILGIVKEQGYAMTEPYFNKVLDVAYQFEIQNGVVSYLGVSNFSTDYKGQYQGNNLNGLPKKLDPEIRQFVFDKQEVVIPLLVKTISRSDLVQKYEGNFGVDALIFRDKNNKIKMNPCLEINVRQNMGLLSLHLEKLIDPSKQGLFRTWYEQGRKFSDFKSFMEQKHPLQISDQKITSGFLALTDVSESSEFGAYILV